MSLNIESNLSNPDGYYERLIDLHSCLSDEQSLQLNDLLAKLLADRVKEPAVLQEASDIAKAGGEISSNAAEYTAKMILLLSNHLGDAVVEPVFNEAQAAATRIKSAA